MKAFAALFSALDETNKTGAKVEALARYFRAAAPEDAAWALFFLTGRRLRQAVPTRQLVEWAREEAGDLPEWLLGECYDAVGDMSETIALILPPPGVPDESPLHVWVERLHALRTDDPAERRRIVRDAWRGLDATGRYVWNKLILGNFRVGVSQQLVLRGLARAVGLPVTTLAERITGAWTPSAASYARLIGPESDRDDVLRPYPFCLAHPLEAEPESLGDLGDWQAEWKWDGIRSQVVRRGGDVAVWSRGEDLITDRFPEIEAIGRALPDGTVLDGEILPWLAGADAPLAFAKLQTRITRKTLSKAILRDVPAVLLAYDLLEEAGVDLRARPLHERRARLAAVVAASGFGERLRLSPMVETRTWTGLASLQAQSREAGAEGLMLKRVGSPYGVGRVRGDWWKWKVAPYTVDAVLTAAQRGSGKRASLYTDYTFSVWDEGRLVTFAKAYSGLTDAEIRRVDAWIRRHMREKFGHVRTVEPVLVFELAFEAIQRSTRHRSGFAVRFPRILRWREDKPAAEADSLATIASLVRSDDPTAARTPLPQPGPSLFDAFYPPDP